MNDINNNSNDTCNGRLQSLLDVADHLTEQISHRSSVQLEEIISPFNYQRVSVNRRAGICLYAANFSCGDQLCYGMSSCHNEALIEFP
jgi:hypothetical protein